MGRSATGLAATWLVSVAPIALPEVFPSLGSSLGESSRMALAALPWVAWLGAPIRGRGGRSARGSSWWASAALAAPPIAAGLGIDLMRGARPLPGFTGAACALAMIFLLAWAADLAAIARRAATLHGIAWLALVPGAPLLRAALEQGGAEAYGRAPGWLAVLAGASPLGWVAGRAMPPARIDGEAAASLSASVGALGACLVLLALGGLRARGSAPSAERSAG